VTLQLNRKIKVLIVDDSAVVRRILSDAVSSQPDMEVVGTAPDPYVARDKILALHPDVITLDIEMPRMDGLTFLRRLMQHHPIPTIIVSSLGQSSCSAALDALRFGAVDVLAKPNGPYSVGDLRHSVASCIRGAASSTIRNVAERAKEPMVVPASIHPMQPLEHNYHSLTVIAIGASTGGTVAIQDILLRLPADIPPTVITQHIPAGFSLSFAERLNKLCPMEVREAVNGDRLERGVALVAPGDFHMVIRRSSTDYVVELGKGPQVCFQRPSVDVMFASVAQAAGSHAIGLLLTGMGTDGAKGLLALKRAGANTIAQDEASCVVYGMPRAAVQLQAVDKIASLHDIPAVLTGTLRLHLSTTTAAAKLHPQPVTL
jgi:two-component system chemotaxis response regulator CheB